MKPKQKQKIPAKKREQKKHISLVIPEKPALQISTEPETTLASAQPSTSEKPKIAQIDYAALATQIADDLGETKSWPRKQIKHVLWALGIKQTQALAKKAKKIEDAGGMLSLNGSHRRTVGGIFFFLAYSEGKPRPGKVLTRPAWKPRPRVETLVSVSKPE